MTQTGHRHCPASPLRHSTPFHCGFTVWMALGGFMLWFAASLGLPAQHYKNFAGVHFITEATPLTKSATLSVAPDKKFKNRLTHFDSALLPKGKPAFFKMAFNDQKAAFVAALIIAGQKTPQPRGPPSFFS